MSGAVLGALFCVVSLVLGASPAAAAPVAPAGDVPPGKYLVVKDVTGSERGNVVAPSGTDCTYPACGEVHNRSGHMLMVSRDANSHLSCGAVGPYAVLSNGQDSNGAPRYWKDTDCFAGTDCSVFYGGLLYRPYEYIRIYNPVWIYNVNC
ncbi:hypothetical protein [Actinoplanes sp. NPDC023714]|uniref:hypothetical protein n=1 Tax=Actinoplanes sp. NPDC023714 TaxID=3154322 RepID=UPI003406F702